MIRRFLSQLICSWRCRNRAAVTEEQSSKSSALSDEIQLLAELLRSSTFVYLERFPTAAITTSDSAFHSFVSMNNSTKLTPHVEEWSLIGFERCGASERHSWRPSQRKSAQFVGFWLKNQYHDYMEHIPPSHFFGADAALATAISIAFGVPREHIEGCVVYSHAHLGIHSDETDSELDESDRAYGDRWIGSGLLIGTDYQHTIIVGGEQSSVKARAETDAANYYYYRDCYLRFPLEYLRLAANGTASSAKHYRKEDEDPD